MPSNNEHAVNRLAHHFGQRHAERAVEGAADAAPFPALAAIGGPTTAPSSSRDPQLTNPWLPGGELDTLTQAVKHRTGRETRPQAGTAFGSTLNIPDTREKRFRDFAFCAGQGKKNLKRCRKSRRLGEAARNYLQGLQNGTADEKQRAAKLVRNGFGDVFIPNYYQSQEAVPGTFGPAYGELVDRLGPIYGRGGRKSRRGGRKTRRGGRKSRRVGGRKSTRVGGRKYRRGGRKTRR